MDWRSGRVGVAASVAAVALLMLSGLAGPFTVGGAVIGVLLFAACAGCGGIVAREVLRRVDGWEARALATRCDHGTTTVWFADEKPPTLDWGPGTASPREVLAAIEGHRVHRRIVRAAETLAGCAMAIGPVRGLGLTDEDGAFQAHVRCVDAEPASAVVKRCVIIVRDPARAGEEFAGATGKLAAWPRVTDPSVLAGVVTYIRR